MKKHLLITLVAIFACAGLAYADGYDFANLQVSEIPIVTTLTNSTDYVAVVVAGQPSRITPVNLNATNVSGRLVALNVSTSIVQATHESKTLLLGGAGSARTMSLPAATGSGARYTFVVGTVNTSNYIITHAGSDKLYGGLVFASDNASNAELGFETGSGGASTITLNGTTTGGAAVGDYITVEDTAAGVWVIRGQVTESGSETTPFS